MEKVLITATVQSHIAQFHKPLISLLQTNGYEVHVAARNNLDQKNGLTLTEPDKIYDIPFERSPFKLQNIVAIKRLREILDDNKFTFIHCNTPVGGVLTRLAANDFRKDGLKVFYTAHGFHFYKGAPLKNWMIFYPIEKIMANLTDVLVTITREDYLLAKKKFNTTVEHIHGVGVDSKRYHPIKINEKKRLRHLMGYTETEYIILCTGELNKNKNQESVIRAMPEVIKEYNNVKLLLAGNGPLEDYLKKLVKKSKLTNHVEFLGYRTDLVKYVNISDLIISASQREGLPLNIIEALLSKKAVIASHNRGHNELIDNNISGSLVRFNRIEEYSEKIISYIENTEKVVGFEENGFKNAQKYNLKNVLKEFKKLYGI